MNNIHLFTSHELKSTSQKEDNIQVVTCGFNSTYSKIGMTYDLYGKFKTSMIQVMWLIHFLHYDSPYCIVSARPYKNLII